MTNEKIIPSETVYCPTTTSIRNFVKLEAQPRKKSYINYKLHFAVLTVNILSFAAGNAHGWPSSAMLSLKSIDKEKNPLNRPITSLEESWIVSLVNLGAAVGTIFAGYSSDKIGRRKTLLIFVIPMIISHITLIFASTVTEFLIWRFIMGLGVGCIHAVIPIYVGEISELHNRGFLGSFLQILYTLGLLFVYAIGSFTNIVALSLLLIIPLVVCLVVFRSLVPESPYYYANNGNSESAETSLSKLRDTNDPSQLLKELSNIKEVFEESKNISLKEIIYCKSFRKGIVISTSLMFFQQFVGIHVFISYLESIFASAGGSISSSTSSSIVMFIRLVSVILSSFLVDIWGRRLLLIISTTCCAFALALIGCFFYAQNNEIETSNLWWIPIFSLLIFMIGFSFGLGPLPWTLLGELFSNNTKAVASSVSSFTSFFLAFVVTSVFRSLENLFGLHGAFWFFSLNTIIGLFFVIYYLPETKGKSFQEVREVLEK